MQVTGMRYGKQILDVADFPTPEVLTKIKR